MIKLRAFGTSARQDDGAGGGLPMPSFLFDQRVQVGLQGALIIGILVFLAATILTQNWGLLCIVPLAVLPLAMLLAWVFFRYSSGWATPAQVYASDELLHRGGRIEMVVRQVVRRNVEYNRLKVQVVMREWVRYPCGETMCSDVFDHIIQEHEELGPIAIARQDVLERRVTFDLPDYMMHTFKGRDNRITWFVCVLIDIRGMPETTQFYQIELQPEVMAQ